MSKTPTKAEVDALRTEGKTRAEIAKHFGISLSKLKRLIVDLDVVPRMTKIEIKRNQPKQRIREKPVYNNPEEGETLMDKAKAVLGDRMGEKYGCYTLDGRPINSWGLMKAAGLSPRE